MRSTKRIIPSAQYDVATSKATSVQYTVLKLVASVVHQSLLSILVRSRVLVGRRLLIGLFFFLHRFSAHHKKEQKRRPTPFFCRWNWLHPNPHSSLYLPCREKKDYDRGKGGKGLSLCQLPGNGCWTGANSYAHTQKASSLFFYLRTYSQTSYNSENQVFCF